MWNDEDDSYRADCERDRERDNDLMDLVDAESRGARDAKRGKAPIFEKRGASIVAITCDDMSDDWSLEMRAAYLKGYER